MIIINRKKFALSFIVILTLFAIAPVETTFADDDYSRVDLLVNAKKSVTEIDGKTVKFNAVFTVENPARFVSLALKKPSHIRDLTLNGKKIPLPLDGMIYNTIPGIPVSMLKDINTLRATWAQKIKPGKDKKTAKVAQIKAADVDIHLYGLTPSALAFQTGPVLGYAGENFFTVTCRVNTPAEVVLAANGRKYVSKPALLHSFKVEGLKANTQYTYALKTRISSKDDFTASVGPYSMRTLPAGGKFTFAVLGDARTRPKEWAKVAAAVAVKQPAFSVFVGDMVTSGKIDSEWDLQCFGPAKNFFATIPYYAVIGNHEQNCPLFLKIFPTPGGSKNWSQEIGSVLLIGIDGGMDWSSGSTLTKWLEDILAKSKAKFIFFATHYPAWTSGPHGWHKNGLPSEKTTRVARDVLMPLLQKYNVAAMFAGHDHIYERSEPDDGVTVIVTGGAGAPMYEMVKNAEKQNPYSKAFASKLHYCLITVDGDVCTMKVITPEGEVIDTRTWPARKGK